MSAGRWLSRLDQKILPPLGRALSGFARGPVRRGMAASLALAGATVILLGAVWAARERPAGSDPVGEMVRVGVAEGQSIPAYVTATRNELAELSRGQVKETYALVSLSTYLRPEKLATVFGELGVSRVYVRVPLGQAQTPVVPLTVRKVPADVLTGMDQLATRKDAEAGEYAALAARLTGGSVEERAQRDAYLSTSRVATAEATAYRAHCACVYAAVVKGSPTALERLAARAEARAVDPAPELKRLDQAVFLPPLPEQIDVIPPVEPAPSLSPTRPAPTTSRPLSPPPSTPLPIPSPEPPTSGPPSDEPTPTPPSSSTSGADQSAPPSLPPKDAPATGPATGPDSGPDSRPDSSSASSDG